MKKILIGLLLVLSLLFVGCTQGSGSVKKTISSTFNSKEMSMEYEGFDGYRQKEAELREGCVINYTATSLQGNLIIIVQNVETEEYLLNVEITSNISNQITVNQDGRFLIKITGENHTGSFSVIIN